MLHIALYQPEIPPNTGNIIRLASNAGARLHLIHPLGFSMDTKQLRRAGLDYHQLACVEEHSDWQTFLGQMGERRLIGLTTHGTVNHSEFRFIDEDVLLFGPETRGLPSEIRDGKQLAGKIRLPMVAESRSLNLSNAVAITLYEAWRQLDFAGSTQKVD